MLENPFFKLQLILILFLLMPFNNHAQNIKVMSYNVKLDRQKEGKDSWTNRKPFFSKQIKFYEPDVLGVQEALPNQMQDLDSLLPNYSYVGVGRDDGKNEGEFSAIFYKTKTLKVLESSTFWLSQTPDKVGMGWDAVCNRICTYALFEVVGTAQKFWVFNTHFDHVGLEARTQSVGLILDKIKAINHQNYPVILSGDFNMTPDDENIEYLKTVLADAKAQAQLCFGPQGTYNGFRFDKPVTERIDYIFVSPTVTVNKYAVLSDSWNLQYPSDHLPVFVILQF